MSTDSDKSNEKPHGFMGWLKHAFAVEAYDESSLSDDDKDVLTRLATRIHEKKMTPAAILWAESHRNLNFVGSQVMLVMEPAFDMTHPFLNFALRKLGIHIPLEDYNKLRAALEKRYSIEYFIQILEAQAAGDYNIPSTDTNTGADVTVADSNEDDGSNRADR